MASQPTSRKLLLVHKNDNALIVAGMVPPADKDVVDGREIVFTQRVAIEHKVAARLIAKGEKIFKCGVPIGSAAQDIPARAHWSISFVDSLCCARHSQKAKLCDLAKGAST